MGELFSIFHKKSASKALKTCDFEYFTSQWGGLEPPPRPALGYATGGTPKLCQNICLVNTYCYQKTGTLAGAFQKIDFWGPILGGSPGKSLRKISGEKIAFAAQLLYAKIRF